MNAVSKYPDKIIGLKRIFDAIEDIKVRTSIMNAYIDMSSVSSSLQQLPGHTPVLMIDAPAGAKMHHWWKGGLYEHLLECWNYGLKLYLDTIAIQSLDFNLSDLATLILTHDISKGIAFQYKVGIPSDATYKHEYRKGFFDNMGYDHSTSWLLSHYGIKLTREQYIALIHTEGGWAEVAKSRKDGNMLSKFMHILDMYSSQILGGKFVTPQYLTSPVEGEAA